MAGPEVAVSPKAEFLGGAELIRTLDPCIVSVSLRFKMQAVGVGTAKAPPAGPSNGGPARARVLLGAQLAPALHVVSWGAARVLQESCKDSRGLFGLRWTLLPV